jgi:hypothetical protein
MLMILLKHRSDHRFPGTSIFFYVTLIKETSKFITEASNGPSNKLNLEQPMEIQLFATFLQRRK